MQVRVAWKSGKEAKTPAVSGADVHGLFSDKNPRAVPPANVRWTFERDCAVGSVKDRSRPV